MPQIWTGFVVGGASITLVDAEIPESHEDPITILYDQTWQLQEGDRAQAYNVLYQHCANHLQDNGADHVVIKGSAVSKGGTKLSHLESAEVRGVVISSAASVCPVQVIQKSHISRNYGDRKVDEYLKDDHFWEINTIGEPLRSGSREAAMLIIAARNSN